VACEAGIATIASVMPASKPSHRPAIVVIAAVGRNGVIGRDGGLAWRDPQDARHFRDTTMGAPVIMGRKTWDSLPVRFRPLPGRRNLVVTRNTAWRDEGAQPVPSLEAALAAAADAPRVFVIGGAELYAHALPIATELVLTEIGVDLDGDVTLPAWDRAAHVEVAREPRVDAGGRPFAFVTYRRRDLEALSGPKQPT
jgi:dihydrofolate reductase